METNRLSGTKLVYTGAFLANLYFYGLLCVYAFGWHHVLIGVFQELLTIPALVALVACGLLIVLRFFRGNLSPRQMLWGTLLLASTVFLFVLAMIL